MTASCSDARACALGSSTKNRSCPRRKLCETVCCCAPRHARPGATGRQPMSASTGAWSRASRNFCTASVLPAPVHRRVVRAESASAPRLPWRSRCSPICCCSMSPPIISTSKPSNDWRRCCSRCLLPSSSPTTAPSSIGSRPASSNWTAACCAPTPATSRPMSSARTRNSPQRTPRGVGSRSSGSRRRPGSARASRPAARATKDACAVSSNCVSSALRDATGSGTFDSLSMPVNAQAIWWPSSMG